MQVFDFHIHIHDVGISHQFVDKSAQIWCVISVDGHERPRSTPSFPMRVKTEFGFTLSIPFEAEDISTSYMYVIVCRYINTVRDGETIEDMLPLCKARTRIAKLPLNGPNAIRMPLHGTGKRRAKPSFYATISGTIDPAVVAAHMPPSLPAPLAGMFPVRRKAGT
jgi:hypothetical protein